MTTGQDKTSRSIEGVVQSTAMKTIRVKTSTRVPHPRYKKIIVKSRHYLAHDEENTCSVGDLVVIEESRARSKNKSWALVNVKKKAS